MDRHAPMLIDMLAKGPDSELLLQYLEFDYNQLNKEPQGSGLIGSLLLDAIFSVFEEFLPKNKTKSHTFALRKFVSALEYDTDIYPHQDNWVFNYIEANYSFSKIKGKSPNDNIFKKELDFINALIRRIKSKSIIFNPVISLFALYIFNKESHFIDAMFNLIFRKEVRFFPQLLYPLYLSKYPIELLERNEDSKFKHYEIFEPFFEGSIINFRESAFGRIENIKDILCLLNEIPSISLFSYVLQKMNYTDLILNCWESAQKLQSVYSDYKIDRQYYHLINALFQGTNNENRVSASDTLLNEACNLAVSFFSDLYDEEFWDSFNNSSDIHLVPNPFNEFELLDHPEGEEFGCPLHILKMPVETIEEILRSPFRLDKCNWEEINNDSSNEGTELKIRHKQDELAKNLSAYSKAFYHLIVNPIYSFALWSIIPFDESLNILDSAKRDGKLIMVNSLSRKRWMSIHDLFCKVSFGNNSWADQDDEYRCFHNSCSGNKSKYCRDRLFKTLQNYKMPEENEK